MTMKEVLSGVASVQEIRKFWSICQLVGFGMMATAIMGESDVFAASYGGQFFARGYLLVLAGLVLAIIFVAVKPSPPKYVEPALVVVIGLLMISFVWGIAFEFRFGGYRTVSVPALGFLLVVLSVPSLLGRVLVSREAVDHSGRSVVNPAETAQRGPIPSSVEPDVVLYISAGGAAAVILSLLAFPWFALENLDWNDAVNITFNDLRSVYNIAKDEGLNGGVRFFYLEWGYIVSYVSAIASPFLAMRLRDKKPFQGVAALSVGIGITGLVGLWLAVLATGLSELDDEGSVQVGMWLGVAGHVALIVALVLMRQAVVAGARSAVVNS